MLTAISRYGARVLPETEDIVAGCKARGEFIQGPHIERFEAAFARHARLGRACREGAKAMGLELFSPDEDRSAVVTAIRAPDGVDSTEVVKGLRDRFGITIANGQGDLKGKIFRIGHIGYYDVFDITTALAAVDLALVELGADIERGVAVTRALEAFEHTTV